MTPATAKLEDVKLIIDLLHSDRAGRLRDAYDPFRKAVDRFACCEVVRPFPLPWGRVEQAAGAEQQRWNGCRRPTDGSIRAERRINVQPGLVRKLVDFGVLDERR